MKPELQKIVDNFHKYNSEHMALQAFGLSEDIEYDALVIAPSITPYKLGLDNLYTVTTKKEGAYIAGYEVKGDDFTIAWIKIGSSAGNLIDHLALCTELKFKRMIFIGAVGALKDVNKILAIDWKNPDLVTSWTNELAEKYKDLTIVKSTPYFCEIGSGKAKKSLGVKFLADLWGIKHEEILGIGDQNNDIDLVMNAGIGVAMGNSSDELKQCAKYITDTVDNDGFARAMEKFVLNCEVENV